MWFYLEVGQWRKFFSFTFLSIYPFIRQNKHGWKKMVLEKFLFAWFLEWNISREMGPLKNAQMFHATLTMTQSFQWVPFISTKADTNLQTRFILPEVYTWISPRGPGSPLTCRWYGKWYEAVLELEHHSTRNRYVWKCIWLRIFHMNSHRRAWEKSLHCLYWNLCIRSM